MTPVKKVCVITGGTSGIGLCTAQAMLEKGYTVYELSRRAEGAPGMKHIMADVTKEETLAAAVQEILKQEDHIDVLINNAGFGISGAVEFTKTEDAQHQLDVNFFGMVRMNRQVLPVMRRQCHGRIVNLSSVAGAIPIPFQTYYSASKAAINSYTMALANEVKPFGIQVCCVQPGDIRTGFTAAREKNPEGDDVYGGRLPVHVRCLIDEAANIGQIPNLEKLMATIRSREISACLVLQAQSQLKALYKDNCDTIIGNCDSSVFLGGKEPTTLKELSAALGKETIDTFNTGESRGRETSHSLNYQKLGKELASVDELAVLDGGKCILQLRGVRPFLSNKYDITKHPMYKYLSDYDEKNVFDIEKYLSTRLHPKPTAEYDLYEIDAADMSTTG